MEFENGSTSGLFLMFMRIVRKKSPSLGVGTAVGAAEVEES